MGVSTKNNRDMAKSIVHFLGIVLILLKEPIFLCQNYGNYLKSFFSGSQLLKIC